MKKKNGFTLIEIIGVVAILGILAVIATPAVVKTLNNNKLKTLKVAENNLADSANLFAQDFCNSPISSNHKKYCKPDSKEDTDKARTVLQKDYNSYFICISDLKELEYFSSDVKYEGKNCDGAVVFIKNSKGKYTNATTYIKCDTLYTSYDDTVCNENEEKYNETTCNNVKNIKNIVNSCIVDKENRGKKAYNCVNGNGCN